MSEQHFDPNRISDPWLREFCDQMPGGYFIYKADEKEELLYANHAAYEIFGCSNEEEFRKLTGYTFRGMVYPEDYPGISKSIIRQINENKNHYDYVEYRIRRKDGVLRWVNDYGKYVEDKNFGGLYYVFISDITRKRERHIKENNKHEAVIRTLTRFYHTVWVIDDIETEHWTLYFADTFDDGVIPNSIRKPARETNYSRDREVLVNSMVVPEDRERLQHELSIEGMIERLKDKDQFSTTFLRQYDDGTPPRYFRIDIGKLDLYGNRMGITIGFKDVDSELRAVRDAERALLEVQKTKEENKRLAEQVKNVQGIADLVDSITSMLSNISAMTFSKDAETGVYLACNQEFAEYAHRSEPDDVVGLTDFDIFDEENAERFVEQDQTALSMDEPYVFYEDVPGSDGTEARSLQTTKVKFTDSIGKQCIMGLCVDVTEISHIKAREVRQQELEEKLKLQERLLSEQSIREEQDKMINALSSDYRSIYHVDLDADDAVCYRSDPFALDQHDEGVHFPYIKYFSKYAEASVDEVYRDGFLQFIDPQNIRGELTKNSIIGYRYLVRRQGEEYYEMIRAASVRSGGDGEETGIHAVVLGFTNVDSEMRDSIAKNEALAQALAAAQEANSAKTAFLSNMGHEIRTPMNAIIGLDSLALQDDNISEKTRNYLEKINGSAHHLMMLINDILDMSRIESGRLNLRTEEFSFRGMLEQINSIVMSQCGEKGLRYECRLIGELSDYYFGDDLKLKQVLINILSNAIKFTEAPGKVTFTVERTATFEDKSTLKFVIKDTGIGISEEFIPKLFDPFTQENSEKKNKYGSTGLGMAITKNIVELMNGTITVESEKGFGSEFTVIVTLNNSDHKGMIAGSIKPQDMRVLVVDSDNIAAEHAQLVLGEIGVTADICNSGKDAMRKLRVQSVKHDPYNLVLLDRDVRGKDSLEIAKKIRGTYDKETTVIIMTAFSFDDIMEEAVACGADSFLLKPTNAADVMSEFERVARKNNINLINDSVVVDLKGKRILMAEDVFINAEIMKQLMLKKEALIDHAENGKIAVEMFEKSEPDYYDAVLMDVRMPEMDGLEATQNIRALDRPDAKKVPIIAMTANAFDEDVQRSLQVGMNAHLSKPVEPQHLYNTLEELIWEANRN